MTDLELMKAHCEACYVHDAYGDLACVNDWLKRPAPVLWLGLTVQGSLWRFRSDIPADARARAERLLRLELFGGDDRRFPIHDATYRRLLVDEDIVAGPTYWSPSPPGLVGAQTTRLSDADADLLRGSALETWIPDIPYQQPMVASVEEGRAVAVCASVRVTPVAHEAGVETVSSHRRRGYAAAAVAAWAREVLAEGALPLYSTSWDSQASQALAARLGYQMFGWEYRLG